MISFRQVTKQFGTQVVLDNVSFQVNPGERVGVVGPNGAGKSTVFNLVAGEMEPDRGSVELPRNFRLGYCRQQLNPHTITAALLEYVENSMPELNAIQAEIHELEDGFARSHVERAEASPAGSGAPRDNSSLLRRLGELQTRFEHLGGYTLKNKAERTLSGLGFQIDWFYQPFRALSGGWQSRAELARVLVSEPDILLLDEPSNYLDIPAVEWLENYLEEYNGTLVLISHDRFLLNSLTRVTIEVANGSVERYPGNYDYYAREREQRYEQRLAAQKNQDRKREQLERFIERFRAKNTLATQAQSRVKQLARMDKIEVPQRIVTRGRIHLRPPPHCGVEVVRLENAGLSYDGERWVLRGLDLNVNRGEKIALVGYNGLGKTTLLRMLGGNLAPTEGKRVLGHKVVIGYQSQDFAETMDPANTVFGTVKSIASDCSDQEVRTMLGGFGFSGNSIEKPVEVLSGGEKIRLAFARLLMKPPNFLLLDEPTTHLDIQAREALETALQDYQGTLCLVSHDIDFVKHVATGIIAMTPPGVTRYAGGYDYYHEKVNSVQVSGVSGKQQGGTKDRKGERPREPSSLTPDTRHPTPGETKADRKEIRKQRAEARQALHEKTKDLKKAIKRVEAEVERLETEKAALSKQLETPDSRLHQITPGTATTNFASLNPASSDYARACRRIKEIQYEIDIATGKWEQATEALEKVMAAVGGGE